MITLNSLRDNKGARVARVRVGRGIGSGLGKTSGKGQKGQKARTGVSIKGFEGGQMPLGRRLPKRGFKSRFVSKHVIINIGRLQQAVVDGVLDVKSPVTYDILAEKGLVRGGFKGIRLLAGGSLNSSLTIEVMSFSGKAKELVEAQGGKLVVTAPVHNEEAKVVTKTSKTVSKSKKKNV